MSCNELKQLYATLSNSRPYESEEQAFELLRNAIKDGDVETVEGDVNIYHTVVSQNTVFKNCSFLPDANVVSMYAALLVFDNCTQFPGQVISKGDVIVIDHGWKQFCNVEAGDVLLTCQFGPNTKVNNLFQFIIGPVKVGDKVREKLTVSLNDMNIGGTTTLTGADAYLLKNVKVRDQKFDNQLFDLPYVVI